MKIIDCFMYFDEDMILDIRLNTLNKYVSKFVICEASYNHKGLKKKLNFKLENFSKFKDKIEYKILDEQPKDLNVINKDDKENEKNSKILQNALKRENFQRNFCFSDLKKFSPEDLIIINDIDEIPNLEKFEYKKKITIFLQKMFYYKFNLEYPDFEWTGSRICKLKHLKSPQWLRNIKTKRYPLWRLDAFLSKKKYFNIGFIKSGGWHFTNIKSAEQIDHKMRNFLHHLEYEHSGLNISNLKQIIKEKRIMYDHVADKKDINKWRSSKSLTKTDLAKLPSYIRENKNKFKDWLD